MKKHRNGVLAAILLLAFAAALTFWITRRESPPPPAATAQPPAPAPSPAPSPPEQEAPVAEPSSTVALSIDPARPREGSGSGAAATPRATSREARLAPDRDETAGAAAHEAAEPETAEATAKPTATAEPAPAEPAVTAAPAPPEQPPPPEEPDGTALARFQNRVGPSFSLVRVVCQIDGQTVYAGPAGPNLQLFRRPLSPGSHSVSVIAEYRGNSAGIFSYAQGYRFKVSSGKRFIVKSGKPVQLSITGYERGGPTTEFGERLALSVNAR